MSHFQSQGSWEFNFEGQLLGFVEPGASNPKYLLLGCSQENLQIKISKQLRTSARLTLRPGDRLQVLGSARLDSYTGSLKLKANRVIPLSLSSELTSLQDSNQISINSSPTERSDNMQSTPPKVKVLVCQKSGCLKRGGKALLQSLKVALDDSNLSERVLVEHTGCLKRCASAPNFAIMPGKHYYSQVDSVAIAQLKVKANQLTELRN